MAQSASTSPIEEDFPSNFHYLIFILNVGSEVSNIEGGGNVHVSRKLYLINIISHLLLNLSEVISISHKLALPS